MAIERTRPAWEGSDRRDRLPIDWKERRREGRRRNPRQICHWCGLPGGTDFDHIIRGDDHSQENLDWIHSRRDVEAGRSKRNCHGEKTGAEGAAARAQRRRQHRPEEVHPALR